MRDIPYDELERENLWAEYAVPMHFITLEFEDVEMERGFQVDMARRRLGTIGGLKNEKNLSLTLSHLSLLAFAWLLAWIKYTLWHPSESCSIRLGARDISFVKALQSEPLVALMSSSFLVWTSSVFLIYYRYTSYVNNYYFIQSVFSIVCLVLYLLFEYLSIRFLPDTDASVTMEEGVSFTIVVTLISIFYSLRFVHVMYLISIGTVVTAVLRPLAYSARVFRRLGFLSNEWNEGVMVVAALCILSVVIYCYEKLLRKDFILSLSLAAESELSDKILKSVLPDHVVSQLLGPGPAPTQGAGELAELTVAESHESVSTLFIEVCGMSELIAHAESKSQSLENLAVLANLFALFDQVLDQFGLEKIKTIGDVYMAVAGLGDCSGGGAGNHAQAAVQAAVAMVRAAQVGFADRLTLRCGIHSGPVVAGVIGRKRFAYDVWGDAVVIASRMQTTAEPDTVHISQHTADLLVALESPILADLHCRGSHVVKGKGPMTTFHIKLAPSQPALLSNL